MCATDLNRTFTEQEWTRSTDSSKGCFWSAITPRLTRREGRSEHLVDTLQAVQVVPRVDLRIPAPQLPAMQSEEPLTVANPDLAAVAAQCSNTWNAITTLLRRCSKNAGHDGVCQCGDETHCTECERLREDAKNRRERMDDCREANSKLRAESERLREVGDSRSVLLEQQSALYEQVKRERDEARAESERLRAELASWRDETCALREAVGRLGNERDEARAENAALRAALEPFADVADFFDLVMLRMRDEIKEVNCDFDAAKLGSTIAHTGIEALKKLTINHCLKARAALRNPTKENS